MTIPQYNRWVKEIIGQRDLVTKMQQYERLCNVFVQDVWLDCQDVKLGDELKQKATIMFELQGELMK